MPHVAKQQGSAHFVIIKPDLWAKFSQGFVKKLVMTGNRLGFLVGKIFCACTVIKRIPELCHANFLLAVYFSPEKNTTIDCVLVKIVHI